jgi:hypothetical protein
MGKARPARKAGNLTGICEPIVLKCGIFDILQPYRPPLSVTGTALFFKYLCTGFSMEEIPYTVSSKYPDITVKRTATLSNIVTILRHTGSVREKNKSLK